MTRTPEGDALTALVQPVFELNGELLAAASDITTPHRLTPAWWLVLDVTLVKPLPVSEIARRIGLARQSVQRVADVVVAKGWGQYQPNPSHRRAKLLHPTTEGRQVLASLREEQHAWANAVGQEVGLEDLELALEIVRRVSRASRRQRDKALELAHGNAGKGHDR